MGKVLASSVIDSRFELRSDQTKDYKIGICCLFAKHAVLRSKSKDGLTRNKDNVFKSGSSDMSTHRLLFLLGKHYKNPTTSITKQSLSH